MMDPTDIDNFDLDQWLDEQFLQQEDHRWMVESREET